MDAHGNRSAEASSRALAAVVLVLAGFLSVLGSFAPWDVCPDTSCYRDDRLALFSLRDATGVELGPGILTALFGVVLAVAGFSVFRAERVARAAGVAAAALVVLVCAAFFLRMHVFTNERYYGPAEGWFVVTLAGFLAIAACQPRSLLTSRSRKRKPVPARSPTD